VIPNVIHFSPNTLFFLYKNVVFPAQAEYSYFSADFRLKVFLLLRSERSEQAAT